jgi:hypothetical protein
MLQGTELEILAWLYEIGTIVGIALFIYSFFLIAKIKELFPGGNIVKKWRIMQLLIILVSVIYIIDWIVWIYDLHEVLFILGGIVRLSTSIFITLLIVLFYKTYRLVLHKNKSN